jgi:hypothetical protein
VKLPGSFLGGAKSRLLPPSLPFRFFAAAAAFHVAAWTVLASGATDVPGFPGGPGLPLAATHLLTLGVLVTAAMGAALQLLPVATRTAHRALWPIRALFWLFVPGVALLAAGMAVGGRMPLWSGGALVVGGLLLFAALIADNVRRTAGHGVVVAHAAVALAALVVIILLGLALVADYDDAILADHGAVARVHLVLAIYGFMGLLALGFSHVLLPMFALSPAPAEKGAHASLALASLALLLASAGLLADSAAAVAAAAALGCLGAVLHALAFERALRKRLRKRLDLAFVLIRAAWASLSLSLLLAAAVMAGAPVRNGGVLVVFLALVGWLLTFLLGVLQRILPFLAALHAQRVGKGPPLASELAPALPLRVHAGCHGAALLGVAAGIALDAPSLVRWGALVGIAGALFYAWFVGRVLWRMRFGSSGVASPSPAGLPRPG